MSNFDDNHSQRLYSVSIVRYLKKKLGGDRKTRNTGIRSNPGTSSTNNAQRDYDSIVKFILEIEATYGDRRLAKRKIRQYQTRLDKIAAKYHYGDSTKGLYCVLYELQALIYRTKQNDELALKFLIEAANIKSTNKDFISAVAQEWYGEELQVEKENQHRAMEYNHYSNKWFFMPKKVVALVVIAILILLWAVSGPVSDHFILKDANPAMIKLAQAAGMSRKGELIFLRTYPRFDSDSQIKSDCLTTVANKDAYIVQGCYTPSNNRIYIREMPSNDYNLEITTAAYELLHPVYQMLVSKNGSQLDRVINKAYNLKSGDKDLISQVAVFAKTEPGAKDEELFSLLGTEYSDISSELASYYTPYFTNLKTDVIDNQKEVALIPNLQTELIQLQVAINIDDSNATVAYNNSVYWANLGNAYEDNHNYNIYLTDFNKENSAIDKYNQIVVQFNTLGTEYYGSQSLNQIQIIQAKSSQ